MTAWTEKVKDVGNTLTQAMLETYRRELADKVADPERLRRAYGSRLLHADLKDQLQAICRTAVNMLGADCALVNIIGRDQLRFAAIYGDYDGSPVATDESYCQHHIMAGGEHFSVEDGRADQLTCNLKVVNEAHLYSYLGVPLIDPDGYVIGSLCVLSSNPRPWRPNDAFMLTSLASTAMDLAYPEGKSPAA
jgi:GAF domain-containing protein